MALFLQLGKLTLAPAVVTIPDGGCLADRCKAYADLSFKYWNGPSKQVK